MTPAPDHTALQTLHQLRTGQLQGCTRLDLRGCGLSAMPPEVLALEDTLEVLDLSGNALSTLPDGLSRLSRLHTLFASANRFTSLPEVLGRLPALDTLGLKANQLTEVPPSALAPSLRWLILTDNRITALPHTLTECLRLQKLMLAGNRLAQLPAGMHRLHRLELLRLSANRFERLHHALPDALLALPRLAWLAHAGNPFSAAREQAARVASRHQPIPWSELQVAALIGEGASGHIHAASWQPARGTAQSVALKLYKGAVTSDGLPQCEMAAALAAGQHPCLLGALGVLTGHPEGTPGLVMPRLPAHWSALAGPPSMASCTRDVYSPLLDLTPAVATGLAAALTQAMEHLHAQGLMHGDVYAHNLLVDGQGQALLSDFGAASFLPDDDPARSAALKALDRRALQILLDELSPWINAGSPGAPAH